MGEEAGADQSRTSDHSHVGHLRRRLGRRVVWEVLNCSVQMGNLKPQVSVRRPVSRRNESSPSSPTVFSCWLGEVVRYMVLEGKWWWVQRAAAGLPDVLAAGDLRGPFPWPPQTLKTYSVFETECPWNRVPLLSLWLTSLSECSSLFCSTSVPLKTEEYQRKGGTVTKEDPMGLSWDRPPSVLRPPLICRRALVSQASSESQKAVSRVKD